MTGPERDEQYQDAPVAWHNRTSTLLGASAVALAGIALVVGLIKYTVTQGNEPEPLRSNFIEPTSSTTATGVVTPTTTSTITSTTPPVTTDINPGSTTPTSDDSGTLTITTRPPHTRDPDLTTRTTRERPRITRSSPSEP